MAGLFGTLNISSRGMNVQQKAIDVTSHNIANAATPGYTKQSAVIQSSSSNNATSINGNSGISLLGNGAEVVDIQRFRDAFIDYNTRVATSTSSQYDTRKTALASVETIFNEPSATGISSEIGKFFDNLTELAKAPDSSSAKTIVAHQSQSLATSLNSVSASLTDLKTGSQDAISNTVASANSDLDQIETLTRQIVQFKNAGTDANDLLDKRDVLLNDLSKNFNFTITKTDNNGINVSTVAIAATATTAEQPSVNLISSDPKTDGKRLAYVNSDNGTFTDYNKNDATQTNLQLILVNPGETAADASTGADTTSFTPSDGILKGNMDVITDINGFSNSLDSIAKALATSVNTAYSLGDTSTGSTPFFVNGKDTTDDTGAADITAANISINANIVSDPTTIITQTTANAQNIANLRDVLLESDGTTSVAGSTTGSTIDSSYNNLIASIGVKSQTAQRLAKNQSSVLNSLKDSQSSVSGVSTDEEMTNLIQYQHAYQANAKMISTIDSLLDVIINGLMK